MAMNQIQFQAGLSLPAFLDQFGTVVPRRNVKTRWNSHAGRKAFVVPNAAMPHITCSNQAGAKPSNANPVDYRRR